MRNVSEKCEVVIDKCDAAFFDAIERRYEIKIGEFDRILIAAEGWAAINAFFDGVVYQKKVNENA